jgi:hypothetical protein
LDCRFRGNDGKYVGAQRGGDHQRRRPNRIKRLSSNTPTISCASPDQNGWKALSGAGVEKRLRMTIGLKKAQAFHPVAQG